MKRLILGLVLVLVACGGGGSGDKPGSAAVYQRIANETSCEALQAEFDTAERNFQAGGKGTEQSAIELSYMEAAQTRMTSLGCGRTFTCGPDAIAGKSPGC